MEQVVRMAQAAGAGVPREVVELREGTRRRLRASVQAAQGGEDADKLRVAIEAATAVGLEREDLQPAVQLLRRLEAMQQPLTFADVSRKDMERLATASRDESVLLLAQCMRLPLETGGFLAEIVAEFHYHNYSFCRSKGFSAEKTSTFLSIMRMVLTQAIIEQKLPEPEARTLFEGLIMRHSQQLPPYSVGVFTPAEASVLKDYARRSFFRHYKMYSFVHVESRELEVRTVEDRSAPALPDLVSFQEAEELDPSEAAALFAEERGDEGASPMLMGLSGMPSVAAVAPPTRGRGSFSNNGGAGGDNAIVGDLQPLAEEPSGAAAPNPAADLEDVLQSHLSTLDARFQVPQKADPP